MYTKAQTLERIIATSTMHQRYCLGFPHEDSSYWTPYTLEATKARYSSLSSGCLHMEKIEDAVRRRQEQPIYRVFVYGSLLRGLENHFLIQNEKFVHRAHTVEEFYMVSNNNTPENNISAAYEPTLFVPQDIYKYPFLMRKPAASGHTCSRIVGEVYEVTAEALAQLDRLEDHPTSYLRQSIQVENMEKGGKSRVDAYILNSEALFTDISTSIAKNLTPCPFEVVKAEHAGSWMRYLGK